MNVSALAAVLLSVLITGCATSMEAGADKIRLLTANQKEQCRSLGIVSTEQRVGPNKPANAMTKALNEAARRGASGIYVVSTSTDWAEGASVTAEALACPQ